MAKESLGSILDGFIADSKQPKKCKTQKWINTLSKEDQTKLNTLKTDNRGVDFKNLFEALNEAGINLPMGLTAFRSHFKEYCTCQK
jgi:hypothetical protein